MAGSPRLITLGRTTPFDEWITYLRSRGEIKNDDCTLASEILEHTS